MLKHGNTLEKSETSVFSVFCTAGGYLLFRLDGVKSTVRFNLILEFGSSDLNEKRNAC